MHAPSGARVVLASPCELGRQPFNLAQPAAWFARAGIQAACLDLSQQKLDRAAFRDAEARINDAGIWLLEIAPRGIGGLCGRVLTDTPQAAESALRAAHAARAVRIRPQVRP
jgi:hypothetical protein